MDSKKLFSCVMTGVLSIGIIGGIGPLAFADTTQESNKKELPTDLLTNMNKIQEMKDELKSLGVSPVSQTEKDHYMANLDADTRKKIEEMIEKIKVNKLNIDICDKS